ncbi:hypothetical protein OXX59_002891 [Metschnikowia pulcherrima]
MINVFRPFSEKITDISTIESLTRDVHLKPIHSHNDYWRKRPFFDALSYGCTSIEGDVWNFHKDYTVTDTVTESTSRFIRDQVYVGHNQVHLKSENTLEALYLTPLYRMLESANKRYSEPIMSMPSKKFGVFFDSPESTLNLWLDLKTEGVETYLALKQHLKMFMDKGYLAYYNVSEASFVDGPVAITLTGDVPWTFLEEEEKSVDSRQVFLDCPLEQFIGADEKTRQKYRKFCLFASASLEHLLGKEDFKSSLSQDFSGEQKSRLNQSFDAAHALGIKTRVWGGVDWPNHVRDMHWKSLWRLGCDLINADDLEAAANMF